MVEQPMTKLRSAEEHTQDARALWKRWANEVLDDDVSTTFARVMASLVPVIQRNAAQHWLERAAKEQCHLCASGDPIHWSDDGKWPYHTVLYGPRRICDAWGTQRILREIPKDPAPAVEHRRGGIVIERGKTPSGNDVTYMTREDPAPTGQRRAFCCYDCGRAYGNEHGFPDLLVQKDVWNKIGPTGHEGGLLCPSCMIHRIVNLGLTDVAACFVSGPLRMVSEDEMNRIFALPEDPTPAGQAAQPHDANTTQSSSE